VNTKVAAVLVALAVGVFAAPAAAQAGPTPPDCSLGCTSDGPVQGDNPVVGDPGCSTGCDSGGDYGSDPVCPPAGCDYGNDPLYQKPYPQPVECHEAHVDDERVSEADGKVTFRISASGS